MTNQPRVATLIVKSCGKCPYLETVPRRPQHYCGKQDGNFVEIYSLNTIHKQCPLEVKHGKEISSDLHKG